MRTRKAIERAANEALAETVARLKSLGRAMFVGAPETQAWGWWYHSGYGYGVSITFERMPRGGRGGRHTFSAECNNKHIEDALEALELKVAQFAALHEDREVKYCFDQIAEARNRLVKLDADREWYLRSWDTERERYNREILEHEQRLREKGVTPP